MQASPKPRLRAFPSLGRNSRSPGEERGIWQGARLAAWHPELAASSQGVGTGCVPGNPPPRKLLARLSPRQRSGSRRRVCKGAPGASGHGPFWMCAPTSQPGCSGTLSKGASVQGAGKALLHGRGRVGLRSRCNCSSGRQRGPGPAASPRSTRTRDPGQPLTQRPPPSHVLSKLSPPFPAPASPPPTSLPPLPASHRHAASVRGRNYAEHNCNCTQGDTIAGASGAEATRVAPRRVGWANTGDVRSQLAPRSLFLQLRVWKPDAASRAGRAARRRGGGEGRVAAVRRESPSSAAGPGGRGLEGSLGDSPRRRVLGAVPSRLLASAAPALFQETSEAVQEREGRREGGRCSLAASKEARGTPAKRARGAPPTRAAV